MNFLFGRTIPWSSQVWSWSTVFRWCTAAVAISATLSTTNDPSVSGNGGRERERGMWCKIMCWILVQHAAELLSTMQLSTSILQLWRDNNYLRKSFTSTKVRLSSYKIFNSVPQVCHCTYYNYTAKVRLHVYCGKVQR